MTATVIGTQPACPKCGAAMYDNRESETYSGSGKISTVQMGFVDRLLDRHKVVG